MLVNVRFFDNLILLFCFVSSTLNSDGPDLFSLFSVDLMTASLSQNNIAGQENNWRCRPKTGQNPGSELAFVLSPQYLCKYAPEVKGHVRSVALALQTVIGSQFKLFYFHKKLADASVVVEHRISSTCIIRLVCE